jgi:chorismate synthase
VGSEMCIRDRPRAVPIVDAMTALVLLDFHLVHHAYFPSFSH